MKQAVLFAVLIVFAFVSVAAAIETYQVTGPVLEVKEDSITVQKGHEKWQIAKDKNTKIIGEPKVGSKVTIKYEMKATSIEAKESAKKEEKKEPKKK